MKDTIREIKFGFQRMFRGYDDSIKWSFEDYFSQFIIPLKEFCEDELKEEHIANGNNPKKKEVFEHTIMLIDDYDMWDSKSTCSLWKYVGEHMAYYWN